jgi:hypothetical protein
VPALEIMLAELESTRLEVGLAPCRRFANEGGCIRVCLSRNADWYRRFCTAHPSGRFRRNAKPDTRIKRRDTIRVLGRLIAGRASLSKYAPEFVALARRRAA